MTTTPRKRSSTRSSSTSPPTASPPTALMKMAKLGAVIDGWMQQTEVHHQRRAVLDVARRVLRRGALHRDEHDERQSDVERLRSGYLRRGRHARAAAGFAKRPARCSIGTTTTATIPTKPSASIAAICPSISSTKCAWISSRSSPARWASENTFGTCVGRVKAGPMSFARFSTDDRDGTHPRLRGRRRVHRRSARTPSAARASSRIPKLAGTAALHLRERLRASRGREPRARVAAGGVRSRPRAIWAGTMHCALDRTWTHR